MGILAIGTAVAAWRHSRRWVAWVAISAVVVIGIQAWVGRLVVTNNLDADLVSLHLAISLTVAGLLTIVAVGTTKAPRGDTDLTWALWLWVGVAVSAAVLMLGSLVHNIYVPGWPLTLDQLIPDLGSRTIAINFLHRVIAAAGLVVTWYLFAASRRRRRPQHEVALCLVAFVGFVLNVGLGAAHVFTSVTWSGLVAAHLGVASIALVALVAAGGFASRLSP